jgi:Fic family protein
LKIRARENIKSWKSQSCNGEKRAIIEFSLYVPPTVDEMQITIDQFEKFIHAPPEPPLLIRIGIIHCQFEAIHLFLNGNGQIGRLLIIQLICETISSGLRKSFKPSTTLIRSRTA